MTVLDLIVVENCPHPCCQRGARCRAVVVIASSLLASPLWNTAHIPAMRGGAGAGSGAVCAMAICYRHHCFCRRHCCPCCRFAGILLIAVAVTVVEHCPHPYSKGRGKVHDGWMWWVHHRHVVRYRDVSLAVHRLHPFIQGRGKVCCCCWFAFVHQRRPHLYFERGKVLGH